MKGRTKQGFVLSVLLHLGVVVGAILFTLFKPREKPPPQIFELVAPPASAPVEQPSNEPVMDFSAPPEPIPEPQPPKLVEEPKPKPPEKKPDPPKPVPVPEKKLEPVKKPDPKPPEPVKQTTLADFLKKNPVKPPPKKSPPKPTKVPQIDTKFSPNLRETVVNVDRLAGLSTIQQSELQSYIARLREGLRLCWDKPAELAETLSCDVEFDVSGDGRLYNVRITRSSGNRQFDTTVRDAFDNLGRGGTPPDGKPLKLRLTFRMTDL